MYCKVKTPTPTGQYECHRAPTEPVSLFSQFQPPSRKMTAAENAVATSESSASAAAELSLAARALEDG